MLCVGAVIIPEILRFCVQLISRKKQKPVVLCTSHFALDILDACYCKACDFFSPL